MAREDLDAYQGAYGADFKFHEENLLMLAWYVERMIQAVTTAGARNLVSLGIGHGVVAEAILRGLAERLEKYIILEGSEAIAAGFQARIPLPRHVDVVVTRFEEFGPQEPLDAVEMGFVLEHVDAPGALLRRFAGFLRPGGRLIVVVPNARSLHRLFGHAAGLLDDVYALSEQDRQLGHKRYFDHASIRALLEAAGLRILRSEGVFLKSLTTAQLDSLELPHAVRRAFFDVGVAYPDIANAIYLETTI